MKSRLLAITLAACTAIVTMAGCGKEPVMESSGIVAERPTEETTEVIIEEEVEAATEDTTVTTEMKLVPTKFEVFTDGEPHYLMFHADLDYFYWDEFTSMSSPEHGIESVSFPSKFVNIEGPMRRFDENDYIDCRDDMDTPIDTTSLSFRNEDEYGVLIPSLGVCGLIDSEFTYKGEEPTIEEVTEFISNYGLGSWDELYSEMSEDGHLMYATYCRTSLGDIYYYGGYAFRIKDGRAQGAYIAVGGDDKEDGMGYIRYVMQSLRFVD